ncbi:hypothetical protein ASPTUDRAFT_446318 [Aspergillus tubingensis CBS 134.48]|uniref:Uncharacterized protein n=1 Tax=Aspergillus tubingensis (strain CBS 134.48) TaxID=767770 RepID=A0A1L9N9X9_ASPTC|nr:hypothetical protein ASPTUDRAFT_446318 [Aspergillus tubingensis CBS 134.48]
MSCLLFPSICCHPYTHSLFLISSPLSSPEVNRLAGRLVWLPAYLLHHHHHLLWRTWSSVFSLGFPQFGFLLSIVGGRSVLGYGYMVGWLVMVSLIGSTWCCSVVACYLSSIISTCLFSLDLLYSFPYLLLFVYRWDLTIVSS